MSDEIQRADPAYRRRTFVLLAVAALLALLALVAIRHWMAAHVINGSPREVAAQMSNWISISVTLCGFCLLALGAYAGRCSIRAARERRWPLPGTRVVRDTRVRHGDAVAPIVRWLRIAAFVTVALAALAIASGWLIRHATA